MINKKIKAILSAGLKPILCIGETIEDRNSGLTENFLENQIKKGLKDLNFNGLSLHMSQFGQLVLVRQQIKTRFRHTIL